MHLKRWQPFALLAAITMTLATIWLAISRYSSSSDAKELHRYFKKPFVTLHSQTKSVQAGIAALVGETNPSADQAVTILEKNIVPSIDYILEQGKTLSFDGIETRTLHAAYLQAVSGMRADALALRELFGQPDLTIAQKRHQAQERIVTIGARFDKFFAQAEEALRANGIKLQGAAPPPATGTGTGTTQDPPQ